MKKLALIILIILFSIFSIHLSSQPRLPGPGSEYGGQACLPEGITFTTQEEIDSFQTNYPGCTEIEGDLIVGGEDIANLNGLSVLTSINGSLVIGVQPGSGGTVGAYNPVLTSLVGLHNLNSTGGPWFAITGNDLIQDLQGLEQLVSCGGILWISSNKSLQTLTGLDNLKYAQGIRIGDNESLSSLAGISSIDSLSSRLDIILNNSLINLTGLENLIYTEGVEISYNALLSSLSGLDNLKNINGDLWIYENAILTNLSGLESLTAIGWNLSIRENYSLTSLAGLENVNSSSINDLHISNNPLLSHCHITSICEYLRDPAGEVNIYGNESGCNSPEEVEEACLQISIPEIIAETDFSVTPNPFTTSTTIHFSLPDASHTSLSVYNITGKHLETILSNNLPKGDHQINWNARFARRADGLNEGIYFIRLETEKATQVQKVIILK